MEPRGRIERPFLFQWVPPLFALAMRGTIVEEQFHDGSRTHNRKLRLAVSCEAVLTLS